MGSGRIDRTIGRSIFGLDPEGYHAARLDYPDALYDCVFTTNGVPPVRTVLEIGAGTGLATARLLTRGIDRLVAVEPDAALSQFLSKTFAGAPVEVVTSDFLSFRPSEAFDLVVAASSFHWLDSDLALPRIYEQLSPGGRIALWWNAYRQPGIGDPLADATMPLLEDIDLPPSESMTGHYSLDTALHVARLAAAGFAEIEHHVFRRERVLSANDVRALYASYSFVRALPEARRDTLLAGLIDLVDREFGGAALNVVLTSLYVGRRNTADR